MLIEPQIASILPSQSLPLAFHFLLVNCFDLDPQGSLPTMVFSHVESCFSFGLTANITHTLSMLLLSIPSVDGSLIAG